MRVETFGLEEELVLLLVGKPDDLVFDRRAVARADGLDLPGVHRRAQDVFADDPERLRRSVAMWQEICRCGISRVRKLKGVGSASPGCSSNLLQSMVRPSRRGGVPVLRRQPRRPRRLSASPSRMLGGSPLRPAG